MHSGTGSLRATMLAAAVAAAVAAVGGCGAKTRGPLSQARAQFAGALRDSGLVADPALLRAIETVPLHQLVQPPAGREAYGEVPVLTTIWGTTESPVVDAVMVAAAKIRRGNKVLDTAPGVGYRAALATRLGAQVCCVAGSPEEAQRLRDGLKRVGCGSVIVELGSKAAGCPKYGPFNVLFGDWDVANVPEAILDQVRNQGRIVLLPRAKPDRVMVLKCRKTTLSLLTTLDVAAVLRRYQTARLAVGR